MGLEWREEVAKGFYHADGPSLLWGMEKAHITDCLIDVIQQIPDWLMKIMFLALKLQLDQGISLGLVPWALNVSDSILGLWFSPNNDWIRAHSNDLILT